MAYQQDPDHELLAPTARRPTNQTDKVQTPEWTPTLHETLLMLMLSSVSFMVALDSCVIITALNAIITDLEITTVQGFWIGTSYLLSSAVTMPFIAEASEMFGRAIALMAALVSFTLGTLLCCLARSLLPLMMGRSLQGIGGAGIMSLSLIIFTDIVPLRYRPKWYGIVLGAWALGNCVGPVLGGLIAQKTTWRWVFYIMFPFCALGLGLTPLLLTLRVHQTSIAEKLSKFDWLGGVYFILSSTLFLLAISWGGVQFSWDSAGTSVPLCLGSMGLIWTYVYEKNFTKDPILHHHLFWSISPFVTYVCGLIQGIVLYGQLYYIPFYFLSAKGYTPIQTGVATLPVMAISVPSSIITGIMVTKTNNYRLPIWIGWTLTTVGCGLTLILDIGTPKRGWVIILIIIGLGHGAVLNAQNFASQAMCKPGDESLAAAMYVFLRQFGMALGVGISGSTFQNVMGIKLRQNDLPAEIARESEAYIGELLHLPDNSFRTQVLTAYVFGFRGVNLLLLALSALALLLSVFIKRFDMAKTLTSAYTEEANSSLEVRTWSKVPGHIDSDLDLLPIPSQSHHNQAQPERSRNGNLNMDPYLTPVSNHSNWQETQAWNHHEVDVDPYQPHHKWDHGRRRAPRSLQDQSNQSQWRQNQSPAPGLNHRGGDTYQQMIPDQTHGGSLGFRHNTRHVTTQRSQQWHQNQSQQSRIVEDRYPDSGLSPPTFYRRDADVDGLYAIHEHRVQAYDEVDLGEHLMQGQDRRR